MCVCLSTLTSVVCVSITMCKLIHLMFIYQLFAFDFWDISSFQNDFDDAVLILHIFNYFVKWCKYINSVNIGGAWLCVRDRCWLVQMTFFAM